MAATPTHDDRDFYSDAVKLEAARMRAAARLMVRRPDLFEGCSSGVDLVGRIFQLDDRGLLSGGGE